MWYLALLAPPLFVVLFFLGRTWLGWVVPVALLLVLWAVSGLSGRMEWTLFLACSGGFAVAASVGGKPSLRAKLFTLPIFGLIKKMLPVMSETEKIAIEAGTVWLEAEYFSGKPDWKRILDFTPQPLTAAEQAFLDGPCERACQMLNEWETLQHGDLSKELWDWIKQEGFMGMIIPSSYGGLGFSASAHSAVIAKLASCSVPLTVTVMVPNSLGPAELLLHYGTEEQKDHYLPRLASAEEIPCFALTEPGAGSDAGAMTSNGVIVRAEFEGEEQLCIKLNWDKRYITLAPVATVLGLAFKLRDPDRLHSEREELGITCALIPTTMAGITIGERHNPLGAAFMNGPTQGEDVLVPMSYIIGGAENAGRGWLMLMQSLSAGRGISLPSMSTGAMQLATRTVGAYASVRKQFSTAIGKFEGIQEPLARIAGMTYAAEAVRVLTSGAVDAGEKPAVASAIVKCYMTEAMRTVTNDAMDIIGGAGISLGPRNIIGSGYMALPVGITVEGANILTRCMIIFGQGAIRCHPWVQAELNAAEENDVVAFDRAFYGHIGFVFQNAARSFVHGLTCARLASAPTSGPAARYYRRIEQLSSSFALLGDVAMGTLGGGLKRKEAITGRLADAAAWMYIVGATLKRHKTEGSQRDHLAALCWVAEHGIYQAEQALDGVLRNLPLRPAAWALRPILFPLGRRATPPSDAVCQRLARSIIDGGSMRDDLTRGMHLPAADKLGLGTLEAALGKVLKANVVHKKIHAAVRSKSLTKHPKDTLTARALAAGTITDEEHTTLQEAEAARHQAITVDSFPG